MGNRENLIRIDCGAFWAIDDRCIDVVYFSGKKDIISQRQDCQENLCLMPLDHDNNLEELFCRLGRSKFRSSFRLGRKEKEYLQKKGLSLIEQHARGFLTERLAPAFPKNDGKQTPMKNHPIFIAQHATGTCCRKCLKKWHRIDMSKELTKQKIDYLVTVVMHWIRNSAK